MFETAYYHFHLICVVVFVNWKSHFLYKSGKYTLIIIYMQGKRVARQHSVVIPNTYMLEIAIKLLVVTFANILCSYPIL